jgi:signal transduction histidine kinase
VRELTAAAGRVASGDLEQRVPVRSRDELGLLTARFNQMSADLGRAVAPRRQMTADIAHDPRTPLTVIAGYLEALRDQVPTPTPERFATLHAETRLLLRLVEDLHTLSLADAGELSLQRQPIAPRQLLGRVADTYRHAAAQQGVALAVEAAPTLPEVEGDPEHLARVLGNLVSNAPRHTPAGGQIALHALPAEAGVRIPVADTGAGIARSTCRASSSASTGATPPAPWRTAAPAWAWPSSARWSRPTAAPSPSPAPPAGAPPSP